MSYTVAVRALCEFTARAGDLDLRFTPAPSALEGMAGHSLVQSRRGKDYETEISLAGEYGDLRVRGRADGFDAQAGQLEEIKTYRGQIEGVRAHHRALHWAQARIYAHLLCQARGLQRLRVALVYFNVGNSEETVLVQEEDAATLRAFFEQQCALFLDWARSEAAHRAAREAALAALRFPMQGFRAGQRELAVAVYRVARAQQGGQCLMAQAPTGIGKTLGTIFPMLKAMPDQGLDRLFFLTAKGTGHGLALQALASVNRQIAEQHQPPPQEPAAPQPPPSPPSPPARLRVLAILARDKACEHPDKACHGDSCPLARGFFDRLPAARAAALQQVPWDPPAVRAVALAHDICPYYLSQELVRWSDVVVADYHYFYDSAAMLYALTQAQQWKVGVLVDEAHNLLERARRMYTAELSQFALAAARKSATGAVRKALDRLSRSWSALNREQTASYQAHEEVPAGLLGAVQRAVAAIADANADSPMLPGDPVLDFYWEALQFMALAEQFGGHALFDVHLLPGRSGPRRTPASTLCIRCVVPAPHLAARHAAAHASVLFSGTLSPPHFYRDILGLPEGTHWLEADSPFPGRPARCAGGRPHLHALPRPRPFAAAHRRPRGRAVRAPARQLPVLFQQLRLPAARGRMPAACPSRSAGLAADPVHGRGGSRGLPGPLHRSRAGRGLRRAGRGVLRGRGPARRAPHRRLRGHAGPAPGQSRERRDEARHGPPVRRGQGL